MTKHIPEWIMIRYAKLWNKFKEKEFTREQAEKIMPRDTAMAVFFSELRKAGWLEMKMSQEDARKTVYKLKDPTKAIIEEINELNRK
ncbi:MAG: hypothetical protein AABX29_07010 [Nanoarchaeota archaeon]